MSKFPLPPKELGMPLPPEELGLPLPPPELGMPLPPPELEEQELPTWVPFVGKDIEQQQFDPKVKQEAKEYLKRTGTSNAAVAAGQELIDTVSFGTSAEIMAGLESLFSNKSYEEQRDLNEAIQQLRRDESPIASTLGAVAGYIVPGLGVAKALKGASKLATGAAGFGVGAVQGAAIEAERAKEGQEGEAVARSLAGDALIGGTLGGVSALIGKAYRATKGSPNVAKSIYKEVDEAGGTAVQAEEILEEIAAQKKVIDNRIKSVNQLTEKEAKDFKEFSLSGMDLEDYEAIYKDTPKRLEEYKNHLAKKTAIIEKAGQVNQSTAREVARFFGDAQYVGNYTDRELATNFMPLLNQSSSDFVKSQHFATGLKTDFQKAIDVADIKDIKRSRDLIKEAEAGQVVPQLNPIIEFFKKAKDDVNEVAGKELVGTLSNQRVYIPHYMKDAAESTAILRSSIGKALGKKYNMISLSDARKLLEKADKNKELIEAVKYIGGYTGKREQAFNPKAFQEIVYSLGDPKNLKKGFDVDAGSLKTRVLDEVPELIREYDLVKLANKWSDSISQDLYMRDTLNKIKLEAEAVRAVDPKTARYFDSYLDDLTGTRRGLAGFQRNMAQNWETNFKQMALEAESSGEKRFYDFMAEVPHLAQYAQAQLYPFFLGMRVDAVARNMTQPYMMTIPEIGGSAAYKSKLISESLPTLFKGMGKKSWNKEAIKELEVNGWLPPDPTPGAMLELRKGIQAKGPRRKVSRALENLNNAAMYFYQQSDIANRMVTLKAGKTLAKDALSNSKDALAYIRRMPPAYRRQALDALKNKDLTTLENRIVDHLISTTQFNYNRASMSEYGRVMGGMFSMFSKWPTAIGAELYDNHTVARLNNLKGITRLDEGNAKTLRKYLGPYLALRAADFAVSRGTGYDTLDEGLGVEPERNPRLEAITGKSFAGMSPLTSVPITPSDVDFMFTPPILQLATELSSGDVTSVLGIIPLSTYLKFGYEKLPAFVNDEYHGPMGQQITEQFKDLRL